MPAPAVAEGDSQLIETARRVLPGGGFGNVSHEVIIAEGKGGRVWDVSGKEYVDYLLGSGPMIVGHAHPEVVEVVQQQAAKGTTFFANNEHGIRLAAEIVDAVACAEQVRFVSTGSEADAYAMRLARAYTGPRQDPEVRGRLSRHERLRPHEPGAQAGRQLSPADSGLRRHPQEPARRECWSPPSTTSRRSRASMREHKRRAGRHHRRAVPAADPAQARLPRRPAQDHRRRTAWC